MTIYLFFIIVASITDIVNRSKIAEVFKNNLIKRKWLRDLLDCPVCFGFWCALILSLVIFPPSFMCIAYGFAGSLFSNAYQSFIDWLQNKIHF